jgi:hypothetical protein
MRIAVNSAPVWVHRKADAHSVLASIHRLRHARHGTGGAAAIGEERDLGGWHVVGGGGGTGVG